MSAACADDDSSAPPVELSQAAATFYDDVEVVVGALSLSPDEMAAAAIQDAARLQASLSDCMGLAGFDYIEAPTPSYTSSPRSYEPAWWRRPDLSLANSRALGFALGAVAAPMSYPAVTTSAYDSMTSAERQAYDAQLNQCFAAESGADQGIDPRDVLLVSLRDTLLLVTQDEIFGSVRQAVASCISDAGYNFTGPDDVYDYAEERVNEMLSSTTPPDAAMVEAALAAESAIASTEADCRARSADEASALLRPAFDEWYETRRLEIEPFVTG